MKTEIDALVKALEAFKAKLVEQEQPAVAGDWIYLHDPTYFLRRHVDWCQDERGDWFRVNGLTNRTIEYAKKAGYTSFRCLRKDSPYPFHQEPEVAKPVDPERSLASILESQ